ncbi:chromosome segregation ATPase [Streptomyces sp. B4I13]|uniref:DUF6262 family protein n=1 Tax=Streptomyces sp. B4I13 TaxID=3042271 RepID=UPI0027899CCB|nr:DUF6262 family protein [Streptomyces sp. B4I13]MDQ0956343.1 chromosome segregation ATPase [Streptomyces sp. B4I13]
MNPRGNPHTLAQARRRVSLDKRQRALTALTTLEQQGKKITHTAVARTAGVSTWLTYAEGIREHIEAAQQRQHPPSPARARSTTATLRTELELTRQEIRTLREDRDRMRKVIQHQLGQQLDALDTGHLTERVDELTRNNQRLEDSLQQATDDNHRLQARVGTLETDLAAARTSLRRMIREENTNR